MKKGNRKKKNSTILDKVESFHPEFLEAIREVYPLAVLSSLSIAISAFSQDKFISAQGYAIAAGISFLLAFVFSLVCRLAPSIRWLRGYAIPSYVSAGFGILFLLLVAWEFAETIFVVEILFVSLIPLTSMFVIMVFGLTWRLSNLNVRQFMKTYKVQSLPTSYSKALRFGFLVPTTICSAAMFFIISYHAVTGAGYDVMAELSIIGISNVLCVVFINVFIGWMVSKKLKK